MTSKRLPNKGLEAAHARTHEQKSASAKKAAETRRRHKSEETQVSGAEQGKRGASHSR